MDRPLHFCMVTTFYPPYHFGGDGMYVYRLSNELAKRGHYVDIIHCIDGYRSLSSSEPAREVHNHPNITVHAMKSKAGILSPLWTQQIGTPGFKKKKIQHIMGNGNFDVIHFHNISLIGGPAVLGYGHAIKLYTMHEYWLLCPMHVLVKFNQNACISPSCFLCSMIHKSPPQLWRYTRLMDKSIRYIDMFISPSKFAAHMHKKMGLQIPTAHIPMFAPKPPETRNKAIMGENYVQADHTYFLFAGRLEKIKGLQELIPVFKEYTQANLLIAGNGKYQGRLQRLARGFPRIKFLGALPYKELMTLYSNATAVIVPSLCYETFGQITIEAFSNKTPVIVKDTGALPEPVLESGGGFVYRDDSELVAAMRALGRDQNLRNDLGQKGYAGYLKHWTADCHLDKYFGLISKMRSKKRAPDS